MVDRGADTARERAARDRGAGDGVHPPGVLAFDQFPRRVVITDAIATGAPITTMVVVTIASLLGLTHVLRIDPARALEG